METHEFAILHTLSTGQFLVDTSYDHEKEEYSLSAKFWLPKVNAYATMSLNWPENQEGDFKNTFEKFKSPLYCNRMIEEFNS